MAYNQKEATKHQNRIAFFLIPKSGKRQIVLSFKYKQHIILVIIIIFGGFLRFYRLGALPVDGDNAFHFLSAKAILKTGFPLMPNGDLYLRSLPLMYLEALSLKIFGISEWSLGLPNAIIGTLNILLVYSLVITIWRDKRPAIVTALFFSISPWAVAVARMPRMYESFLMSVMLIWIFFYKWYYLQKNKMIFPLIIFSLLAISLHQAAMIPLTCFMLPLLLDRKLKEKSFRSAIVFIILGTAWFGYKSIIF